MSRIKKLLIIGFVGLCVAIACEVVRKNNLTPQQREVENRDYEKRKNKDERESKTKKLISNIQIGMMQKIQSKMKNPDSFDLVKFTHHMKDDNTIRATMQYRGTNGFGGVVTESMTVDVDVDSGKFVVIR